MEFDSAWSSFEGTIIDLMHDNNEVRNHAEEVFKNASSQPNVLLPLLVHGMQRSGEPHVRKMTAVTFRRIAAQTVGDDSVWTLMSPDAQQSCKVGLLQAIRAEQNAEVARKVCDCVSRVFRLMDLAWIELLPFMFDCCKSPSPIEREVALRLFEAAPDMFGDSLDRYAVTVKEMLYRTLGDAEVKVRVASTKATVAFLLLAEVEKYWGPLRLVDLLDVVFKNVSHLVTIGEDGFILQILENVVELAQRPLFFKGILDSTVQAMGTIIMLKNDAITEQTRYIALELLVSIAEYANQSKYGFVRKSASFAPAVIPLCLQLMTLLDDDLDAWTNSTDEDEESDEGAFVGEQALDRLACALGGRVLLPVAFSVIPAMLQSQRWEERHAGLMAISAIGEGCNTQMRNELSKIVDLVVPFLQDSNPRVRYATCNAIGQMATDFGGIFQKTYHMNIAPALLHAMADSNPRVQAHGAAAVVNFCENARPDHVTPYLQPILAQLYTMLQSHWQIVKEQTITTIATVADRVGRAFADYYDTFVPVLTSFLEHARAADQRLLRGKAMECISLIGLAVGKEKFAPAAVRVMDILKDTSLLDNDDPQLSYMLSAWTRICKILGADFIPYLPMVIPPLLQTAKLEPDCEIVNDSVPGNAPERTEREGWESIRLEEDTRVFIKTSVLEEKNTACEMIVCFARELKGGFAQYVPDTLNVMVPLLKFYFHEGVREAAAMSLPYLLQAAIEGGLSPDFIAAQWNVIVSDMSAIIEAEEDLEIISEFLDSMSQCIEIFDQPCLSSEQQLKLAQIIDNELNNYSERANKRLNFSDEDYDDQAKDVTDLEDDADNNTLRAIADFMHALFLSHKTLFLPTFEHLLPKFAAMLDPARPKADHQWALCVFDDLIEYTGPESFRYSSFFLGNLSGYALQDDAEVRQAAVYGLGVAAMHGGQAYGEMLRHMLPQLIAIASDPKARTDEWITATENVVSAIGKICKYVQGTEEALPSFISLLPVTMDEEEATHVYTYVCELIESNNVYALGKSNERLPIIVKAFAGVLGTDLIKPELELRISNILRQIESGAPQELKNACYAMLSEKEVAHLQAVFANPPQ